MNKKTFVAAIVIFALVFLLVGVQVVGVANVNFGRSPGYVYPSATVLFPTNGTVYHTTTLNCRFSTSVLNPNNYITAEWIDVYLDNKLLQTLITMPMPGPSALVIENLTVGQHHLEVTANVKWAILSAVFESGRSTVDFSVQSPINQPNNIATPTPTLPSMLSASLAESASSLYFGNTINFTVTAQDGKEPYTYSWNVDNQTAETSTSPYFSTDNQTVGEHHVFVTVTDAENNTTTTLTVAFDVLPNPNSSPSPSQTPEPTPLYPQGPIRHQDYTLTLIVAAAVTAVIAVLLAYFVRRRKP